MPGPWEKYAQQQAAPQATDGPWAKYAQNAPQDVTPEPQDERNGFQKMVDSATQRHDPNYAQMGPLSKALDNFGRGAAGAMLSPIAHPLDAMNGAVNAISHPVDTAKGIAKSVKDEVQQNGAMSIPYALGNVGGGLIAGEAGGPIGRAMERAAPSVAESALGIDRLDRAHGRTPGRAILDDTTGVKPESIRTSGQATLNKLVPDIEQMAKSHKSPVDISPAHDVVDSELATTEKENNLSGNAQLQPVKSQLTDNHFGQSQPFAPPTVGNPSAVLSPYQTAEGALSLKRGLRNQFVKNWNPAANPVLPRDVARSASGAIDKQLDKALGPEFATKNQRISSLIPVVENAEQIQRHAPLAQRITDRVRAKTGALTGMASGAMAGHAAGGIPGAFLGGTAGLVLPELIGGPTSTMAVARALDSPAMQTIPKALTAAPAVGSKVRKRDE